MSNLTSDTYLGGRTSYPGTHLGGDVPRTRGAHLGGDVPRTRGPT